MIFEVVLLALASTIRPTSLAAVSTLLGRDARRRLMLAYVIGGLAFALVVGLVVVGVFHGIHLHSGSDPTKGVADIAGGVVALVFGIAVMTHLVRRRPGHPPRETGNAWTDRLDHHVTIRVAAIAGALTHLPGIFYLIALNIIVAHNPELPGGILAVAIYDGIWFALPIIALVICIVDTNAARDIIGAVQAWTRPHSHSIIVVTSLVVGVALVIRGALSV
jgi:Sap, sulfolipid-1-addressing protein